jgi:ribokinase
MQNRNAMKTFAGFGALNLDLIFEVEDFRSISTNRIRLTPGGKLFGSEGEFQSLLERLNQVGTLKAKSGGGSAANTTVALARMGFQSAFIGKVGEDKEGDFLLLQMRPVHTNLIRRGQRSGICLVVLDHRQDRFLFVTGNANNTLALSDIDPGDINAVSWFHLTAFVGEDPFEVQKAFLDRLESSVEVSLDPGEIYAKKGLEAIRSLIRRSHILFITEKEIQLLTGQGLPGGARTLMEIGPSILVCKKGSRGSHVFSKEEDFGVPATPVEVVDNTGAGDVYNAGFLAGLFLRKSLEESALFASKIAAKSITGYGRSRYPTEEDLKDFFHE